MSGIDDDIVAQARMMFCASCGKSELDGITLMECADCKSVRYCSVSCQQDHRSQHEGKCKEYQEAHQAAELRDEILFRHPESRHLGDCPICFLPLPVDLMQSIYYSCCSKMICNGCGHAHKLHQLQENRQHPSCPFCRHPIPRSPEETQKNLMKRIAANDPFVIQQIGAKNLNEGDFESAFKYFTKAVELGDAHAHFCISGMYLNGDGVEKDEKKEIYHLEEAAIQGHVSARHNLGVYEERIDRAVKHFVIAASLGFDRSMQTLKEAYKAGDVSKEDYAATLRAHHAAVAETKSEQRDAAAKADQEAL